MKKKKIKSTDILDAVAYATLDHDEMAGLQEELVASDTIIEDFDEFDYGFGNIFPA